jgi:glycogen(starch) synthase
MMRPQPKLRIAYLSGPVNAGEVYKTWCAGQQLGYFGASHITDFFNVCSDIDAEAYLVTTLEGNYSRQRMGRFLIENRPTPSKLKGIWYHVANVLWLIRIIPKVVRFRPHIFVVTAAQNYWFLLAILDWFGITIIAACTCAFWPKYGRLRMSWRILRNLNRIFFSHCVTAVMTASEDINRQVRSLLRGKQIPIVTFLPVYDRKQFSMFRPANIETRPFRIFFAGRIEKNKGVYDLVTIARYLNKSANNKFRFDICGDGSELKSLRERIEELGMTDTITCHGFCERSALSVLLQQAHVVIVPTTTQFEEGFNMVCAEAILAGRPLITSAVCPALEYVKEAAIEVRPDDVKAYCQALLDLANDHELYARKCAACKALQGQFFDVKNDWGNKLRELLRPWLGINNEDKLCGCSAGNTSLRGNS